MKLTVDQLAQKLAAELGAASLSTDASMRTSHSIDGSEPALVCTPETQEQIGAVMRICHEAKATVAPCGAGTATSLGNAAPAAVVALDLKQLNRLMEHDHANLTATVEAGMPLRGLQTFLAEQKQFLPLDPAYSQRATLGGIVAANLNGVRRSSYGSIRDLVIGLKVVLASGECIKAGGKVVKNVAGYDMCKLFVGSLGTLGIITQITLRTSPIPERAATLIASGTAAQVNDLSHAVVDSPLLPAAVVLLNPLACEEMNHGSSPCTLAVWSEGFAESVTRHVRDAQALAGRLGLATELIEDNPHNRFWAAVGDFPLSPDRIVFRLSVPHSATAAAIKTIESWETNGFRPAMVADTMAGTVWIATPASDLAASQFAKMITYAREQRGHAVMLTAPRQFKESVDVWGPPPATLGLMRKIKAQFDPDGLLNPGRYIAAI